MKGRARFDIGLTTEGRMLYNNAPDCFQLARVNDKWDWLEEKCMVHFNNSDIKAEYGGKLVYVDKLNLPKETMIIKVPKLTCISTVFYRKGLVNYDDIESENECGLNNDKDQSGQGF